MEQGTLVIEDGGLYLETDGTQIIVPDGSTLEVCFGGIWLSGTVASVYDAGRFLGFQLWATGKDSAIGLVEGGKARMPYGLVL